MPRHLLLAAFLVAGISTPALATGPAESIAESEQVLNELMAIPARQIPRRLLDSAEGIVIVPNVIKIGFIGGVRRGHGVVLVRDAEGEWSLPQFVTLTGGSVGFQAGIQGSDVVLVFTTRKGVEGLTRGKFTIGVDAAAAAGPVGRETAVGTDATLLSEIYSYSRSRGLFAGVSIDGSALEIDHAAHAAYYGMPTGQVPARIPGEAADLRQYLSDLASRTAPGGPTGELPPPPSSPRVIEGLRRSLIDQAGQLHAQLNAQWRDYLALPGSLQQPDVIPSTESLAETVKHYAFVKNSPDYRNLAQRPEFQRTYELLLEYEKAVTASHPVLELPPPPKN